MKKTDKSRFQQRILEAIAVVSLHPDSHHSDTILITKYLEDHFEEELMEMGIKLDHVGAAGGEYNSVLTQLNNLHKKGILTKNKSWNPPNRYIIRWRFCGYCQEAVGYRGALRKT